MTSNRFVTVPLGDINEATARNLIGSKSPVTLKVYEGLEATEPAATVTGTLNLLGTSPEAIGENILVFTGSEEPLEFTAEEPATLTFDSGLIQAGE